MKTFDAALFSAPLEAMAKLVEKGAQVGVELFESWAGKDPSALGGLFGLSSHKSKSAHCCSCEIPPPCWMPQPLCEVESCGKPCNKITVQLVITNCSVVVRQISLSASPSVPDLSFSATTVTLGPMERTTVEAVYTIPANFPPAGVDLLLWIRGCKTYFLRWRIKPGLISANTCYEVEVKDCPDLIHHWYDHFYCPRPCPGHQIPTP